MVMLKSVIRAIQNNPEKKILLKLCDSGGIEFNYIGFYYGQSTEFIQIKLSTKHNS